MTEDARPLADGRASSVARPRDASGLRTRRSSMNVRVSRSRGAVASCVGTHPWLPPQSDDSFFPRRQCSFRRAFPPSINPPRSPAPGLSLQQARRRERRVSECGWLARRLGRADSVVNPSDHAVSSVRGAVGGACRMGNVCVNFSCRSQVCRYTESMAVWGLQGFVLFLHSSNQFGQPLESFL